jgi:hypothetical protein
MKQNIKTKHQNTTKNKTSKQNIKTKHQNTTKNKTSKQSKYNTKTQH